jgi:hypothetical protein
MEKSFRRGRAELILHAGDLSYANCDPNRWDSYAEMTAPLAQFLPWMVCAGNHEIEQSAENPGLFAAFEARYHMPSDKPATIGAKTITGDSCTPSVFQAEYNYGNSFYSFSTGLAHFIVLSSYSVSNSSSEQFAWLKADLAEVNRTITPWIVVTMHCPWYV